MSITLKKLDYADVGLLEKILEWRNNEITRKFSNNTNIITSDIFQKIIEKYKESNINPLIIILDGSAVGILTFVNNNNKIYIGINIDPDYRNKNVGTLSLDYFKKNKQLLLGVKPCNIYALVNKNNHASLKLFYKYFIYLKETENYIEFIM
jgi:RimJ/RimL family protein N-acetyltransferase